MRPLRPYKTTHDYLNSDTKQMVSGPITINLFDVDSWFHCDNNHEGFTDKIKRTVVNTQLQKTFVVRTPYEAFDKIMSDLYRDYQLLDTRSDNPPIPDSRKYEGPIKATFDCDKKEVACIFHRHGYEVSTFEDAVFNCLFKNITPMN